MASQIVELVPDGSDWSGGGSDFTLSSGSDLDSLLSDTSLSTFISATASGKHNTLTFANPTISYESINYLYLEIIHMNTTVSSTSTVNISFLNGAAIGNPEFDVTDGYQATLISATNTAKAASFESVIMPQSDGTDPGDAFTSGNLENLKVKIETASVSNTLKITSVSVFANLNVSDPAAISTYPAKKGMKVHKGRITVGKNI